MQTRTPQLHIARLSGLVCLIIVLCAPLCELAARPYCIEQWACVEDVEDTNGVSFWVENLKPYPFTATVDVSARNLTEDGKAQTEFDVTKVVKGNSRVLFLRLNRLDRRQDFGYSDDFRWTPGDMNARHTAPLYEYPYEKNKRYRIVQGFGGGFSHRGASRYAVDFAMPVGTPVHAARGGTVIDVVSHHNRGGASRKYAKYANFITILHDDHTTGDYYHLRQGGVEVKVGDRVKTGQLIGYSGNTGFSSLPHLHFAVYRAKPFGKYESLPFSFRQR